MIQFNLLPDVKLAFIKAQRIKQIVIIASGLTAAVALILFIGLVIEVDVVQKGHLNKLTNNINTEKSELKSNADLNKILTIQNQLESLPSLDAKKPSATRLFTYLTQLTPATATISTVNIDFGKDTLLISGNADSLKTINQFVDTFKFTTYSTSAKVTSGGTAAFSQVVLSNFAITTTQGATYTINLNYQPDLFKDTLPDVHLIIPSITTTRSVLDQPTDLFKKDTTPSTQNPSTGGH